ncbi:ribonuclease P protein component [Alkalitalea saponilacus]|uniref:Ribonuclease P protein component n=1 Tax=Alkalitalea saponilacus TaxID=889453 RepID=A0A1T5E376_9BACT|nr:ribonuclease P protein component [Alkalitalea saponilacus]ASB49121.1 ribonuclease P protein component [Alkalitalea saponilacus]SKB78163.1 ribonuclease P protein component [Alkalitalea saponilacus]
MQKGVGNSFGKQERLFLTKQIEQLFSEGRSVTSFPLRIQYLLVPVSDQSPSKVLFSVPKKRFKRAVKRNLIRRKMREAFRLNKQQLYSLIPQGKQLLAAVVYINNEVADYQSVEKAIIKAFDKLKVRLEECKV